MAPYLLPIERPKGLIMKMVYTLSRRQAGTVITPVSVFAARMPIAFGNFYGKLAKLDKKLVLASKTACSSESRWPASTPACFAWTPLGGMP